MKLRWTLTLVNFPGGSVSKKIWLQCRRCRFDPWFGKISWRRKWQPTLVFLPGDFHGQRSLVGSSPWGHKESESWAVKKAECQRIDAFELWCWRRLLRVPWPARRSNQSIVKEIRIFQARILEWAAISFSRGSS